MKRLAVFDHNMALKTMAEHMSYLVPSGMRTIAVAHAFVTGAWFPTQNASSAWVVLETWMRGYSPSSHIQHLDICTGPSS